MCLKEKYVLIVAVILIALCLIGLIFFNQLMMRENIQPFPVTHSNAVAIHEKNNVIQQKIEQTDLVEEKARPFGQDISWVQEITVIQENTQLNRQDKILGLVQLLKQNQQNIVAVREILTELTTLNPIEAVDEILPFLNHPDFNLQILALGALSNASLLTEQEQLLKHTLRENDQIRQKIVQYINALKDRSETSATVQHMIVSIYATIATSNTERNAMMQQILQQSEFAPNEANYIATLLLQQYQIEHNILILKQKNQLLQDEVIINIASNIEQQPDILNQLSRAEKKKLFDWIQQVPPQSRSDDFAHQNELWKNTLNQLQQ